MDAYGLREQLKTALEDLEQSNSEVSELKERLKQADEFMRELKDKLSLSMKKRKELLQQLARQSEESNTNEELTEQTKLCEKLSKEVIMLRHEMESGTIKFTQEIEEKRKAEDNLRQSLKEKSEECHQMDRIIRHLESDLEDAKDNEEKLEDQIASLKRDLQTANEYKEKFKISSAQLEVLLGSQKRTDDKYGLGYEKGESSGSGQKNLGSENPRSRPRRPPVRQPNAQRYPSFNGYCHSCNHFGHKANQCRMRMNQINSSFSGQCFNCKRYGHKSHECRIMQVNKSFKGRCFTCNRVGHMANQCRSRGYQSNMQRNVICQICNRSGHNAKVCRNKNQDKRGPVYNQNQDKGKQKMNADEVRNQMSKIWVKKSSENVEVGSAPDSGADISSRN